MMDVNSDCSHKNESSFNAISYGCWLIRASEVDELPGAPEIPCEWDGIAEQWFASKEDFTAAYDRPASATRSDTLAHTSRFGRLIVEETELL